MQDPLDRLSARFPKSYTLFAMLCVGGLVSSVLQWTTDSTAAAVIPYALAVVAGAAVVGQMMRKDRARPLS